MPFILFFYKIVLKTNLKLEIYVIFRNQVLSTCTYVLHLWLHLLSVTGLLHVTQHCLSVTGLLHVTALSLCDRATTCDPP